MRLSLFALALPLLVLATFVFSPTRKAQPANAPQPPAAPAAEPNWDADYFPYAEGNVWVYRNVTEIGDRTVTSTRLKTVVKTEHGLILSDRDGDDYQFASTAEAMTLNAEYHADGTFHTFTPPLVYASPKLLQEKKIDGESATEDGKIKTRAEFLGLQAVTAAAFGTEAQSALATTFTYSTSDTGRFEIHNWLVKGVGAARREFRMYDGESQTLHVTMELLAARVGTNVWPKGQPSVLATAAFRHAFEHRETWNTAFKGLTGEVVATEAGKEVGVWPVTVDARGGLTFEKELPAELTWAQEIAQSMLRHRSANNFDEEHGSHTFEIASLTGPRLGIKLNGDSMGSNYEVFDGAVWQVSRLDGHGDRFQIDVKEVTWDAKGKRYRPRHYVVSMFADGKTATTEIREDYQTIGGFTLPLRRALTTSDGTRSVTIRNVTLAK